MNNQIKKFNRFVKSAGWIIFNHPKLIFSLFTFDYDKIYCEYYKLQLKSIKKLYKSIAPKFNNLSTNSNNKNDFLEQLSSINKKLIKEKERNIGYYFALYQSIMTIKPKVVIETGIWRGVSSLFILQALEDIGNKDSKLYSIDLPLVSYSKDSGEEMKSSLSSEKVGLCVLGNLKKRWITIFGDSKNELPKLLDELAGKEVDFFIHDSEHTYEHMIWEYETIWPHLNKNGGLLFSDDVNWNASFNDFIKKVNCNNSVILRKEATTQANFGIMIKKS